SDYFLGMFTCKMKESLEGVVRFDDVGLPVFRQVIKFIYTGSVDFAEGAGKAEGKERASASGKEEKKQQPAAFDMPRELLAAADRFGLTELRSLCASHLAETITTDNAAELLMLADTYHANDLKVSSVMLCQM